MKIPICLCVAVLIVVVNSGEIDEHYGRYLEPLNVGADQETINYLLPKLTAKYRPNNDWSSVTDPRFYLLTEMESNNINDYNQQAKRKRNLSRRSPSLSIADPIDTLRRTRERSIALGKMEKNRQFLESLN